MTRGRAGFRHPTGTITHIKVEEHVSHSHENVEPGHVHFWRHPSRRERTNIPPRLSLNSREKYGDVLIRFD